MEGDPPLEAEPIAQVTADPSIEGKVDGRNLLPTLVFRLSAPCAWISSSYSCLVGS